MEIHFANAKQSLGKYVGQVTPAEMQGLLKEQARIVAGDPDADIRGKVSSTISTFGVEAGLRSGLLPIYTSLLPINCPCSHYVT